MWGVRAGLAIIACLSICTAANAQLENAMSDCFGKRSQSNYIKQLDLLDLTEEPELMTDVQRRQIINKVRQTIEDNKLDPFECAVLHQVLGRHYYELGEHENAIKSFQAAISSEGLHEIETQNLRLNIAQLYVAAGYYEAGQTALEEWISHGGQVSDEHLDLIVMTMIQNSDFERALPYAQKWFKTANPKERKHYDLMNYLYNQIGDLDGQISIVKEMLEVWPQEKQIWIWYADLLERRGFTTEAFSTLKLMYASGFEFSSDDILRLTKAYDDNGLYYEAAELLSRDIEAGRRSFENLSFLTELWLKAREEQKAKETMRKFRFADRRYTEHQTRWGAEKYLTLKQCDYASKLNGQDRIGSDPHLSLQIAECFYEEAQLLKSPTCYGREYKTFNSWPWVKAMRSAIRNYQMAKKDELLHDDAKNWIKFLRRTIDLKRFSFNNHCGLDLSKEFCFFKIKEAYDSETFTGKWRLEDKNCLKYKAEYDRLYRQQ